MEYQNNIVSLISNKLLTMKYSTKITVALPLDEFLHKFNNTENMKHWQKGLIAAEHISGTPGELGSKMKLVYKLGKRVMELVETITHANLPYELHATYTTHGMHNIQENYFKQTEDGQTIWTSDNEFVPLSFTMKLMTKFMPSAFKKQSLQYMVDFKNFAEKGTSVANA